MNKTTHILTALTVLAILLPAGSAHGTAINSAQTGNWTDSSTWSGSVVPKITDDATILNGHTVTVTDVSTHYVKSLTIQANAVLTHGNNSASEQYKVILNVADNLTIDLGGKIDVDRLGYDAGQGTGNGGSNYGASHGGRGGVYNGGPSRLPYGSVTVPVTLGSGGIGTTAQGGGVIILTVAGATMNNGAIMANGGSNGGGNGGSGAGGSVYLTTGTLAGNGSITANGPATISGYSGGGGGGRIAVIVTNGVSFGSITMQTFGGDGAVIGSPSDSCGASAGTIYLRKQGETYGTLLVDNNNEPRLFPFVTTITNDTYQFDTIIATNAGILEIGGSATITLSTGGSLMTETNSRLIVGDGTFVPPSDFIISNTIVSFSGTNMNIWTSTVTVANSGVMTHERNKDTEANKLMLTIDGSLTVDAGASVDASTKGFTAGYGPTPGGGNFGAGHGGEGGKYNSGTPSTALYGSLTAPMTLGSGGMNNLYAHGGGAIVLVVSGMVTNDGVIAADGEPNETGDGGAGAGGSVYLTAASLAGNGTNRADGASTTSGYAGGGGRTSVILTGAGSSFSNFTGAITAYGGIGSWGNGAAGTVYKQTQAQGVGKGDLIIDNSNREASAGAVTEISSDVTDTTVGNVTIRNEGNLQIGAGGVLSVNGNWTKDSTGYTTSGTGKVAFIDASSTSTVTGDSSFNLYCATAGKRINFTTGVTVTVSSSLTLAGAVGDLIDLNSTLQGSDWYLTCQPESAQSVSYVAVEDSNASGGDPIGASNSINVNNNTNWIFGGATLTWVGSTDTDWGTAANWSLNRLPTYLDTVVIPDVTNDPVLDTDREAGALTISTGSLNLNGHNLTIHGATDIDGTLTATGAETITFKGNVDFTDGTFTQAQSTVTIAGTTAQSVTTAGKRYFKLLVANASAVVTFSDSFTTTYFNCETASVSMQFHASTTYTVAHLKLIGTAGNLIILRSTIDATPWNLNVSGTHYIRYVDAQDSNAEGGDKLYAKDSDGAAQNNTNWDFGTWVVWNGSDSTAFSLAANWVDGVAPVSTDCVLIDGNYTNAPTISSTTTLKRLVVGASATSVLTVNGTLTVSEDTVVGSSGTLNHGDNSTAETYKLNLIVQNDFAIEPGGEINVDGLGYNSQYGSGKPISGYQCGGSYGGKGSVQGTSAATVGPTYGVVTAPIDIGSGGGSGSGGGAVIFTVSGASTIAGTISVCGTGSHAGSGGSIFLTTGTFAGNGTMCANGGDGTYSSGGGGRVAVILTGGDFTSFNTSGGTITAYGGNSSYDGAAGTVYKQTQAQGSGKGTVIIDNNVMSTAIGVVTEIPPRTNAVPMELQKASVIVTNTAKVTLSTNAWVSDILIYTNSFLTLTNFYLHVDSREHSLENLTDKHPDDSTNRVDHYDQILWEGAWPGTLIRFR